MTDYRKEGAKQLPNVTPQETSNTLYTEGDNSSEAPRGLTDDKEYNSSSSETDSHLKKRSGGNGNAEYVKIGGKTYMTSDLEEWLARDRDLEKQQPETEEKPVDRGFANPMPVGLSCFAFCCLLLNMVNAHFRHVTNNKIVLGGALFYGGVIELLMGMLCYPLGDTFGMTVLCGYSGFWFSWAWLLTDQSHIMESYGTDAQMLRSAIGLYLICWVVFTTILWVCTMKSTWGLFLCFTFLEMMFILLAAGEFTNKVKVSKAGGWFGIFSALTALYIIFSGLSNKDNCYIPLRQYALPKANFPR